MRSAYGAKEIGIGAHAVTIVVDVANVMGSRPDGWWRDRAGAAVRLHADLVRLAASGRAVPPGETDPPDFVMVLEGAAKAAAARLSAAPPSAAPPSASPPSASPPSASPPSASPPSASPPSASPPGDGPPGGARPGEVRVVLAPGSGDDAIVAVVRELPGHRVVVTADRELRERCVAAGAATLGPSWLLGLLRP
jgi:8-oxo-dGTP diphosphatase